MRIGRSELRTGRWLLGVGITVLIAGVWMFFLAISRPEGVFHLLLVIAISASGTMLVLGTQKFRNGRATLRDEIRRQAEAAEAGGATEDE